MSTGRRTNGQFAKGHSGNANGNPLHRRTAALHRQALEHVSAEKIADCLASLEAIWRSTAKDRVSAANLWLKYVLGEPKQVFTISGDTGDADDVTLEAFLRAQEKIRREQAATSN